MTASRVDTAKTIETNAADSPASAGQLAVVSALCAVVEWLFVLVVAILPIDAYIFLPGKQNGIFLSEALSAQALVLFVVGYLLARWWRIPFPLSFPLRWLAPLGALLGVGLISLAFAHSRATALRGWTQYAFFFVIFLFAVAVAQRPGVRNRVFWAILTGYMVVVLLGLLGAVPGAPDIAGIILNVQRLPAPLPGGLTQRAESTFRFPDELNAYLLLVLPFLISCALTTRSNIERAVFALYIGLGMWLLLLTYARSALLIIVIMAPFLFYLLGGKRLGMIGGALVLVGLAVFLARDAVLQGRAFSLLDPQNGGYTSRLTTWQWALNAFIHRPLFGVGPRNLQYWPNAPWADAFRHRREDNGENSYLNTLAELGVMGFAVMVAIIVLGLRRLRAGFAQRDTWLARSWSIGFLVGFCALLLDSLVHSTFTSTQVTALACAFVGLAGVYPRSVVVEPHDIDIALAKIAAWEPLELANQATALQSRVVFLINSPGFGGAESHSINLAIELHRRGVHVLVVCPPGSPLPPLLAEHGVPCRNVALGMPIGRMKGVLGTLNLFNPMSHSQFRSHLLALASEERSIFVCPFPREQLLATPLCRQLNTPILWVIHTPMRYLPHRYLLRWYWHRQARQATMLATVSPGFAKRLARDGFQSERLHILPSAVPEASLLPPEARADQETVGKLVIASRLMESKGIQYALDALPLILWDHPEAHLFIAGSGNYESALRQRVRRLGLEECVTFVGYLSSPTTLMRQAQALLYPSVDAGEILPATIIEAFGVGVPVVASRIASIPEIVHPGETGILTAPGDAKALAEAVCSLLDDPTAAREMGERGYELVRSRYTFERTGSLLLQLLQREEAGELSHDDVAANAAALRVSEEMRAVHRPRLLGATGLFVIARILTAFATALWTVLAARALTPTAYGNLMLAASLAELSAIITDAGVTTVATRELAGARDASEVRQWTIILMYLKVALGLVAMLVTIILGFVLPFGDQARLLLIVLSPGLVFVSLNSLTLVFRARMLFPVVVRIALVVALMNILTALAAYVFAPSALTFALADLIATIVAGALTTALVYQRTLRGRWAALWPRFSEHLTMAWGLLLSSLALGLSMALNIFYVRIDVPLLALLTNSAQVAVYISAYRVIDVVSLLPVSAAGVALPLLVSLGQRGREHLRVFAQQYLDVAVVCGVFIALVLTLAGHEVIALLYGSRYAASAPVLLTLSWAGAAMFVTNVFSPLAVALDQRRALLVSGVIGLVVNVGLNLLLIPWLGPVGCAWATLFTELAVTAILATASLRNLHWRPDLYTIAAAFEATGAALLSLLVTRSLAAWESDALAILIWIVALTILAPGWVTALVSSLVARLSGHTISMVNSTHSATSQIGDDI